MSLTDSKGMLSHANKELMHRWQEAHMVWSDKQSDDFDKNVIQLLAEDVRSAITAIDSMNTVMRKIESECG